MSEGMPPDTFVSLEPTSAKSEILPHPATITETRQLLIIVVLVLVVMVVMVVVRSGPAHPLTTAPNVAVRTPPTCAVAGLLMMVMVVMMIVSGRITVLR